MANKLIIEKHNYFEASDYFNETFLRYLEEEIFKILKSKNFFTINDFIEHTGFKKSEYYDKENGVMTHIPISVCLSMDALEKYTLTEFANKMKEVSDLIEQFEITKQEYH